MFQKAEWANNRSYSIWPPKRRRPPKRRFCFNEPYWSLNGLLKTRERFRFNPNTFLLSPKKEKYQSFIFNMANFLFLFQKLVSKIPFFGLKPSKVKQDLKLTPKNWVYLESINIYQLSNSKFFRKFEIFHEIISIIDY